VGGLVYRSPRCMLL